jgi:endonuclease YncB( thermonuclease family)
VIRDRYLDPVEGAVRRLLRFCALTGALLTAAAVAAGEAPCRAPPGASAVSIKRVIDGDTVVLGDGRSLRLIGVNAPEVGHRGGTDDPLGAAAAAKLAQLLQPGGLRLVAGREAFDSHGRSLGDLFLADGSLAAAALVHAGLGFAAVVPPNDAHIGCVLAAEREARAARRGVWADPSFWTFAADRPPEHLAGKFRRASGTISARTERRGGLALDLDGEVELWVPAERRAALAPTLAAATVGARLTVRGWWGSYRGRPSLRLTHPAQVEAPVAPPVVETGR